MPVLYPYKNALSALRLQSQGCKAFGRSFKGKGGWRFSWDSAVLERLVRSELWQGLRMLRSFEDDTPINFNPHRLDGRVT